MTFFYLYDKIIIGVSMKYEIDGNTYDVVIEKKNNRNTYIRVKEDLTIYVTTSYFITKSGVIKILDDNISSLRKMLDKRITSNKKKEMFFYLGQAYDIIFVSTIDGIDVDYPNIYVKDAKTLNSWYKKQIKIIFEDRFNYNYSIFNEGVVKPVLKIRTMRSRWGVYNKKNHSVTLNSKLIEYNIEELDYVIIHELSHIIHFNHSVNFWNLVSKYCPNYKKLRKRLKE